MAATVVSMLRLCNTAFMLCVGLGKAMGRYRHHLSPLAGWLEFIGSLCVLVYLWEKRSKNEEKEPLLNDTKDLLNRLDAVGSVLIIAGLGVIVSTPKRNSIVCWTMLLLNFYLVSRSTSSFSVNHPIVKLAFLAVCVGVGAGLGLTWVGVDERHFYSGLKKWQKIV
ncbi:hypothetical protein TrLO_g2093 [Triparma laevis f. longispina]|uniref:Transmembrane protein n=1 Tax=Triparma laevis f. longispina TaxID=1714387 RepID=A0A9W7FKR6_9STRA|nr:hypothetical protein TrLO_g2093 [Triparma laevis f. longispina]